MYVNTAAINSSILDLIKLLIGIPARDDPQIASNYMQIKHKVES